MAVKAKVETAEAETAIAVEAHVVATVATEVEAVVVTVNGEWRMRRRWRAWHERRCWQRKQ